MELQFIYVAFDVHESVEAYLRHHTANEGFVVSPCHWQWAESVAPPAMKVLAIVPVLDDGNNTFLAVFCEMAE